MQIIIHGGMPKTASSTLQQYFHSHREALAEARILYPDLGDRSHWILGAVLGSPKPGSWAVRRLRQGGGPVAGDEALARLGRHLRDLGRDDILLLSHEDFSSRGLLRPLLRFIAEHAPPAVDVRHIAYARDPVGLFPSVVQQILKRTDSPTLHADRWVNSHQIHGQALCEMVARERLTLRAFSAKTLRDGDVIADFSQAFAAATGRTLPLPESAIDENSAYSAPACAILQLLKSAPAELLPASSVALIRRALRTLDGEGSFARLTLPETFRRAIVRTNRDGWNRLVERMSHDDAEKAVLLLPDESAPDGPASTDSGEWVLSCFDPAYAACVSAALRACPRGGRNRPEEIAAWLEQAAVALASSTAASAA